MSNPDNTHLRPLWNTRWRRRYSEDVRKTELNEAPVDPFNKAGRRQSAFTLAEVAGSGPLQRIIAWVSAKRKTRRVRLRFASDGGVEIPNQPQVNSPSKTQSNSNSQMTRKRLKLYLRNVKERGLRCGPSRQPSIEKNHLSSSVRQTTPDSGCHSLASSATHTPSSEREIRIHHEAANQITGHPLQKFLNITRDTNTRRIQRLNTTSTRCSR